MGAACLGRIYREGTDRGGDRSSVTRHEARKLLAVHGNAGCRLGGIRMGIRDAGHFRKFESLSHVHDTDRQAALRSVYTDFDDAVRSFGNHQQSSLVLYSLHYWPEKLVFLRPK